MPKLVTKVEPVYRDVTLLDCEPLIKKFHYSHRVPSAVKLCYAEMIVGPPRKVLACCTFSIATGRWEEELWELTRLVCVPTYTQPLTRLISKALGHIRQHRLMDLLVSFADAQEDHHGGIYQACSWVYDGMRGDRLDGFNIDGEFVPARTCNALYGTSSEVELPKKLKGKTVEPHYDSGKHCYWKALSKEGMRKALRMGLKSQPYPKPMLSDGTQTNYAVDEQQRKGLVKLPGITAPKIKANVVKVDVSNEL